MIIMWMFAHLTEEEKSMMALLYDTYENAMYHIAYSILDDSAYAEDTVHMTFIKISDILNRIESDYKSNRNKAFILQITKNTALNYKRQLNNQNALYTHLANEKGYTEVDFVEKDSYVTLKKKMFEIDKDKAQILILKYELEFTTKEISEIMGITIENVKVRLHRAKIEMKKNKEILSFKGMK